MQAYLGGILEIIVTYKSVQVLIVLLASAFMHWLSRTIIGIFVNHLVRGHRYGTKLDAKKQARTLKSFLGAVAAVIIWIVTVLYILTIFKVNIAALMTGAGLVGVIFGFGAQSVIRDFVAGLFIVGENQYRVGDVVRIQVVANQITGTVEDLTLRITRLRDMDGNVHIVNNGVAQVVTNLSYKYANVNVDVTVAYGADIDAVETAIDKVGADMAQDEAWKKHILEPIRFLRVADFSDSGIRIKVLGRVSPAEQWSVAGEFRRRLMKEFQQKKILLAGDTSISE